MQWIDHKESTNEFINLSFLTFINHYDNYNHINENHELKIKGMNDHSKLLIYLGSENS